MKSETEQTAEQIKEHMRRQAAAAEATLRLQKAQEEGNAGAHVSSTLTTATHVGKIAAEPHKTDEMEALKTDQEERTGVTTVETVSRTTEGKGVTDEVVSSPATEVENVASARTEADKNAEVLRNARGGKKKGKKGKR